MGARISAAAMALLIATGCQDTDEIKTTQLEHRIHGLVPPPPEGGSFEEETGTTYV